MKHIVRFAIALAALLTVSVSCEKLMPSKDSIDAQYVFSAPSDVTVSLKNLAVSEFVNIVATVEVNDTIKIMDYGVEVSTSPEFTDAQYAKCEYVAEGKHLFTSDATLFNLAEKTNFYVRAYAYAGGSYIYSDAKTITTERIPLFGLAGSYVAQDYSLNDDDEWEVDGEAYEVVITLDESTGDVKITGIMGFDATIEGTWDEESSVVTVPSMQVVGYHNTYGDMFLRGVADDLSAYTGQIFFNFTAMGGTITTSIYALCVNAGYFGFYCTQMVHVEEE